MPKPGVTLPSHGLWKLLGKEDLDIIDAAAYKILHDVGVFIDDEELLKMVEKMGGSVNYEKKLVTEIPEHVVKENVKKAPRNFILAGRDPEWDIVIEGPGRKQFWAPESGATDHIGWDETKKTFYRRRASSKDTLYGAKIVDGIDEFDHNIYLYDAAEEGQQGLPSELNKMNAMLQGTTKWAGHLCTTVSDIKEHDYVARLGAEVAGGAEELRKRPLFWTVYNYIGTLQLNRFNSWLFRAAIKHHFPIMPAVTAAAPLQGPAMAAGNTAISHAGVLFMIALQQFYNPGTAAVANNIVFSMDPKTGRGSAFPAHGLLGSCAMNQLWHELYGLPTSQYGGVFASSLDQQAFSLSSWMALQTVLGTDMIFIQCGTEAFDPALIPICAEIARGGKHLMSTFHQISPTPENLALDVIKEVGAKGEKWMTHKYNLSRLNMFAPPFCLDTHAFDDWLKGGAPSWVYVRCREKLKELEKHEPEPLPKDVVERMNVIVKEGNEKLKVE
ncbi:MAG: trimethylamine methyltransferase family protein [Candidatus Jordarchaeum sp.]|uniref:trimethylamine methyltransferase family protein n=1 Tax=Candidatus Jordarchaeum sp. TaxID=2823881 RepID=UPI00404A4EF6